MRKNKDIATLTYVASSKVYTPLNVTEGSHFLTVTPPTIFSLMMKQRIDFSRLNGLNDFHGDFKKLKEIRVYAFWPTIAGTNLKRKEE